MNTGFLKLTLRAASAMTLFGAYLFAVPDSAIGALNELPPEVPILYRALTGLLLVVFGVMYAWMAVQPVVVRPLLYLGACGKGGAFLLAVALWAAGATSISAVFMLSGDAVFSTIWFSYLLKTRSEATRT